jgi:hypothetical protein
MGPEVPRGSLGHMVRVGSGWRSVALLSRVFRQNIGDHRNSSIRTHIKHIDSTNYNNCWESDLLLVGKVINAGCNLLTGAKFGCFGRLGNPPCNPAAHVIGENSVAKDRRTPSCREGVHWCRRLLSALELFSVVVIYPVNCFTW